MKNLSLPHPLVWFKKLRKPLGISGLISLLLCASLITTVAIVGGYSAATIFESKYQDVIGLLAADAERSGNIIQNNLEDSLRSETSTGERRHPDVVSKIDAQGRLETLYGNLGDKTSLKDFRLNPGELNFKERPLSVFQLSGVTYVAALVPASQSVPFKEFPSQALPTQGDILNLWRIPASIAKADGKRFYNQGTTLYLTTREGRLIYSNDDRITATNFGKRPLVKSFLDSPLTRGYTSVEAKGEDAILGAFIEIPRSNLILFVETKKEYVLENLSHTLQRSLFIFTFIVMISLVILQFPLRRIVMPIQELVAQAEDVSNGNFRRRARKKANGEVQRLADAFDTMCESLQTRDLQIQDLATKEIERVQLHNELVIAQNIQNNLLPNKNRIMLPGLTVDALYRPASLCAGDWYFTKHDEVSGSTLFVIADVSGHGVGASMFTAIIAGFFNMYIKKPRGSWDLEDFTRDVNMALFDLGKTSWHVSLIVGVHYADRSAIDMVFCGHVPPYLSVLEEGVLKYRFVNGPSDVLGLTETVAVKKVSIPFPKGSYMILYTDGLTESKDPSGKAWGNKRLTKAVQKLRAGSKEPRISELMKIWDEFRGDIDPEDDVCVISLAAS